MSMRSFMVICVLFLSIQLQAQTSFQQQLADSAFVLTRQQVIYDPSYYALDYPNGDVPAGRGVCTDVVIRAYRMFDIDLQQLVHEDMAANFKLYPDKWGLSRTDKNIDHRRVPNLMTFFGRYGTKLQVSDKASSYKPGDVVCWDLGSGVTHIGIVSAVKSTDGRRYQIIHNIGRGQVLEDCLFAYKIIGHYRYQ